MSTTKYLEENYSSHPAYSFPGKPYRIDLAKVAAFDTNYKLVANGGLEEGALFEATKIKLAAQANEIFGEMRLQTNDEYERMFLDELEGQSLRLLNEELGYYQLANKSKYQEGGQEVRVTALKTDRHFFGEIGAAAVSRIMDISSDEINVFRSRAAKGQLKREDLSANDDPIVGQIVEILNDEFRAQGVLDAVSAYTGFDCRVGGLAIELSVPQATWWRDTLGTSVPPKTMYAHVDESIIYPKAIVYLSTVTPANGPTSCYPGVYEELHLNALQEIIGRVLNYPGSLEDSVLKSYYGKSYHQTMSSNRFRQHFMRLPAELRFNSHMGWDVVPGSETEQKFMDRERVMTGAAGTYIVFDGGRLFHRGGMVESGERIALQVIFAPAISSPNPSLYRKIISLPRRIVSKIWRLVK